MKKPFTPNFNTPKEDLSKEELNKLNKDTIHIQMAQELRDNTQSNITWEVEQIAKSFGFYLEFDRSIKGADKNWMYMLRIANPGGGSLSRQQYEAYDLLSEKYGITPEGSTTLRATTRQTFQFHWVNKEGVLDICKTMAEVGHNSLNGCGDNTRNVMACPLSRFSNIFDANALAHKLGNYFQLPLEPFIKIFAIDPNKLNHPKESFSYNENLLNRKFKIGISTVHHNPETGIIEPDNCIESLTNDMAIAPIIENNKVVAFQIYVGGGQGERNGKPSLASLAEPLCIVSEKDLLNVLSTIVQTHQTIGDRQNRFWARLKYVIKKQGIDWFKKEVETNLGYKLEKANTNLDIGTRQLHHGWFYQETNNLWTYGIFIENGRIQDDGINKHSKSLLRKIMQTFPVEMSISASQDILISNIPENAKDDFEELLKSYKFNERNGKPISTLRKNAGACVGLQTCRLSYTESEKFEPVLMDQLEELGWGNLKESIGITGCERQCYRPATKSIGLVGSGLNRYMFKLFGDVSGQFQGRPLISSNGQDLYLRSIIRDDVPLVINILLKDFQSNSTNTESLGSYHRRIGDDAIITLLKDNSKTAPLMEKPFNTTCVID